MRLNIVAQITSPPSYEASRGEIVQLRLRTFPKFKEAAQALAACDHISEWWLGRDGQEVSSALSAGSINSAFNALIAKGMPSVLSIVEEELKRNQAALDIAEDIMRFLLDHPAARRVLVANFTADSPAWRVLTAVDAAGDDEQEEDELRVCHTQGLTVSETRVFLDLPYRGAAGEAGIGRDTAAEVLAMYQRRVEQFTAAKGSLLRALATQNDHGSIPPD